MRKVEINNWEYHGKIGWFHGFSTYRDRNKSYPVVMVELDDGQLDHYSLDCVKFVTPYEVEIALKEAEENEESNEN